MDDTQVEVIARRWCQLAGEDPNKQVQVHKEKDGDKYVDFVPYWQIVALEIVPMFAWLRVYLEFMQPKIRDKEVAIVIAQ